MNTSLLRFLFAVIGISFAALSNAEPDVPDTMEQRLVACSQCHGENGVGLVDSPAMPRLAEKPAGYLYKQMQSIKAGEGQNRVMEYLMHQLSPEYMKQIALYYSEQEIPEHKHRIPDMTEAELKRGEELVKEGDESRGVPSCQSCHGASLTGVKPMIPGIINQPYDYMVEQLNLWRKNKRSVESTHCMRLVAMRMLDSDVEAVAAWLATQPVPDEHKPVELEELDDELPGWCKLGVDEVGLQ